MIYGLRRMIYLHCKYDIISVPSYAEGIYHRTTVRYHIEDISPVPSGTDIIVKNLFCQVDKRGFLHGLPDRIRTCDLQSRSLTRYPAEPRADVSGKNKSLIFFQNIILV